MTRLWIRLVASVFALVMAGVLVRAWLADRAQHAELAAALATARKELDAASARQRATDATLAQQLAAIENAKRRVTRPSEIVRKLSRDLTLPKPIVLASGVNPPPQTAPAHSTEKLSPLRALASKEQAQPPISAVMPADDLKPLYDFTQDCKACQARLSAAQSNLADEQLKTAALTRERDAAVRVAKGGSLWHRVARAAKWFAVGAVAGAVAAKTTH